MNSTCVRRKKEPWDLEIFWSHNILCVSNGPVCKTAHWVCQKVLHHTWFISISMLYVVCMEWGQGVMEVCMLLLPPPTYPPPPHPLPFLTHLQLANWRYLLNLFPPELASGLTNNNCILADTLQLRHEQMDWHMHPIFPSHPPYLVSQCHPYFPIR